MRKLFFSLFSIMIFSGVAAAQATTTDSCKQFSGIVVTPPENIDKGIFIKGTNRAIEAKGIVVNPCQQNPTAVLQRIYSTTPKFAVPIRNPFQLNKPEPKKFLKRFSGMKLQLPESTKELFKKPGIF